MNIDEYANNRVQRLRDKYGEQATTQHNKIRMKRKIINTCTCMSSPFLDLRGALTLCLPFETTS